MTSTQTTSSKRQPKQPYKLDKIKFRELIAAGETTEAISKKLNISYSYTRTLASKIRQDQDVVQASREATRQRLERLTDKTTSNLELMLDKVAALIQTSDPKQELNPRDLAALLKAHDSLLQRLRERQDITEAAATATDNDNHKQAHFAAIMEGNEKQLSNLYKVK